MAVQFLVVDGTTPITTGVVFTTNTDLPDTAHGVTDTNQSGVYVIFITPATYTTTTDVTYNLKATIGTGTSAVTRNRQFTTKGKVSTTLTVTGAGNATTITTNRGTLQMSAMDGITAVASPTWSVTETDGTTATTKATIYANGLLTAVANGTVK